MNRVVIIGIITMLCALPPNGYAQVKYDFSPVNNKINGWLDSAYYPGAALMIVKDGRVIFEKCYGQYTPETEVYIASAGKWLAAAALAAVTEDGRLSWDDPVNKWLPEFTDIKGTATLRQLFSHTSGFPGYQPANRPPDNYSSLRVSVSFIQPLPADTMPGRVFHYGGLGMQVAGRMAEVATGKDWETIFQEKIAGPLGMTHTFFTPVDTTPGHSPMLGGGARTTLGDYIRFLEMFANRGMYKGKRVLSEQSVQEMTASQTGHAFVPADNFLRLARGVPYPGVYGLGLWREEVDSSGAATLITSPSWAGAYPWIDCRNNVCGFFIAHVNPVTAAKHHFSSFYASYVLPMMVREVLKTKSL
ncbi:MULTISPECIES: serine hydrolase domain-containing protein [unclassified Chitinophaga]|uniref:serine hydrolase domain-containing protein n=1 Tax=unclassified Chitinophaga TaxID=2619133 RepID=UPI00300F8C74